ncbi:MAG: hypothetical protein ACTSX7_18915 [Alphaproteobacteria bacterium]
MGALIRNVDLIRARTGAHVMLVHHSGKTVERGAREQPPRRGRVSGWVVGRAIKIAQNHMPPAPKAIIAMGQRPVMN